MRQTRFRSSNSNLFHDVPFWQPQGRATHIQIAPWCNLPSHQSKWQDNSNYSFLLSSSSRSCIVTQQICQAQVLCLLKVLSSMQVIALNTCFKQTVVDQRIWFALTLDRIENSNSTLQIAIFAMSKICFGLTPNIARLAFRKASNQFRGARSGFKCSGNTTPSHKQIAISTLFTTGVRAQIFVRARKFDFGEKLCSQINILCRCTDCAQLACTLMRAEHKSLSERWSSTLAKSCTARSASFAVAQAMRIAPTNGFERVTLASFQESKHKEILLGEYVFANNLQTTTLF